MRALAKTAVAAGLLLFLANTCQDLEGDDAGECSDEADNDSDGLFDCDDSDCFGAPPCQGNDDDATDDDDGPDDDDATDDDDAADDDDATSIDYCNGPWQIGLFGGYTFNGQLDNTDPMWDPPDMGGAGVDRFYDVYAFVQNGNFSTGIWMRPASLNGELYVYEGSQFDPSNPTQGWMQNLNYGGNSQGDFVEPNHYTDGVCHVVVVSTFYPNVAGLYELDIWDADDWVGPW